MFAGHNPFAVPLGKRLTFNVQHSRRSTPYNSVIPYLVKLIKGVDLVYTKRLDCKNAIIIILVNKFPNIAESARRERPSMSHPAPK